MPPAARRATGGATTAPTGGISDAGIRALFEVKNTDQARALAGALQEHFTAIAANAQTLAAFIDVNMPMQLRKDLPGIDGGGGRMSRVAQMFGGQGATKAAEGITSPLWHIHDGALELAAASMLFIQRWQTNFSEPVHAAKALEEDEDLIIA